MKERPILMRGPLVLATLEDRKTQTRRVITPQRTDDPGWLYHDRGRKVYAVRAGMTGLAMQAFLDACPYGKVGDHLWVREAWAAQAVYDDRAPSAIPHDAGIRYRASQPSDHYRWRPAIHMPRALSRLTLEITGVRVERVQAISELDCECELGAAPHSLGDGAYAQFRALWNAINATRGYAWEANSWVWVISYRRLEAPE